MYCSSFLQVSVFLLWLILENCGSGTTEMLSKITWSLFNLPSEYLDGLSLETNHALGDLCSR